MERTSLPVPVGPLDATLAARLSGALRAALDGAGPAVAPVPEPLAASPTGGPQVADVPAVPPGVALVVRTSGSTGRPRSVMLDATALRASADATHERLAGPGRWVLALPLAHVAGLQVLVRSLLAGHEPVVVPASGGFDPRLLAEAVVQAPDDAPLYTSLVPTQLHRVLAADRAATLRTLRRLDAVLVGGAAAPAELLDRARDAGLRVVTTYGMTETCGGCVYDGVPLRGVQVRVEGDGVLLGGPVLARGYAGRPDLDAAAFRTVAGGRWFRTQDDGVLVDGRLEVLGRRDDVIVTGGTKVAPAAVESALAPAMVGWQVCVVGLPDAEWGQAVTAVLAPAGRRAAAPPPLPDLRSVVARRLGPAAAPRRLVLLDGFPERGPGKVDRREVARRAAAAQATPRPDDDPQPDDRTEHDGHPR